MSKHFKNYEIGGEIVKEGETYTVSDNNALKNLIVSKTVLHKAKRTTGHSHRGQDEVYIFVSGSGKMEVGGNNGTQFFEIAKGDITLITEGDFHRVYNTGNDDLVFICVFNGKRSH